LSHTKPVSVRTNAGVHVPQLIWAGDPEEPSGRHQLVLRAGCRATAGASPAAPVFRSAAPPSSRLVGAATIRLPSTGLALATSTRTTAPHGAEDLRDRP